MLITDGIEKLNLGDMKELIKLNKMPMNEALTFLREFRDKNGLTNKQAKNAFTISQRIFILY